MLLHKTQTTICISRLLTAQQPVSEETTMTCLLPGQVRSGDDNETEGRPKNITATPRERFLMNLLFIPASETLIFHLPTAANHVDPR